MGRVYPVPQLRVSCLVGVLVLAACAPGTLVTADGESGASTSESTTRADGPSGQDDDSPETGVDASTSGAVDSSSSDAGESSTGVLAPGCEDPGACDASCLQWEVIRESNEGPRIEQVAITPDGTVVAVEGFSDTTLLGYEPSGRLSFEILLDEEDPGIVDVVTAIDVAADGKIAILRHENPSGVYEFRTTLYVRNADGSAVWDVELGDDATSVAGMSVVFAEDGTIIVAGDQPTAITTRSGFVTAVDTNGGVMWELDGADLGLEDGRVNAIAAMSATDFALAGSVRSADRGLWLGQVGFDGTVAWTTAESEDALVSHHPRDVEISPDGDIVVVGTEGDGPGYPVSWLGRFAADGTPQLSVAFEKVAKGLNELDSIEVGDDGRMFVAGLRSLGGNDYFRQVLEVDCDANIAWQWLHEGPGPEYNALGGGLAYAPGVGLVAGGSESPADERRGFIALLTP